MTLLARLRSAMAAPAAGGGIAGDWALMPDAAREDAPLLTPAAVLIAVTAEPEPQLLLTRRTAHLRRHAGQIAFPGGRVDAGDADAVAAALREAEEEVALPPAAVEVLGCLDRYETGTGFSITPVVALVPPGLALVPHVHEVAEVFHVPFAHVMDPASHQRRSGVWQGLERHYFVIPHGEREIWGATAAMLVNLSGRL